MDRDAFDELVADLDAALVVVTARHEGDVDGCLVGFHSQTSIEPLRYGIWMSTANRTYRLACRADALAVHALGAGDHDLAEWFGATTGDRTDPFAGVPTEDGPLGTVLITSLPHRFVGRVEHRIETGGDHVLVVLEPIALERGAPLGAPLRLTDAADIAPGHPARS